MDELALIRRLRAASCRDRSVVIGIGDDAAAVRIPRGCELLLKADMIVEGVHFTRASSPRAWGRKAVNCNVSDIAAMGGEPRHALLSVGLPASFTVRKALDIHAGALEALRLAGASLVGGDTCRSERVVISVAMTGVAREGRAWTRAGAKPGDVIFVTGPLGGSLRSGRHLTFRPRLAESKFLAAHYPVSAAIDVSDGLAQDLRHLSEESRAGLEIYESAVPLGRGARSVRDAFTDGEDFEIVFTLPPRAAARLLADGRAAKRGLRFYPIGFVTDLRRGLRLIDKEGRDGAFPKPKDHHFSA